MSCVKYLSMSFKIKKIYKCKHHFYDYAYIH